MTAMLKDQSPFSIFTGVLRKAATTLKITALVAYPFHVVVMIWSVECRRCLIGNGEMDTVWSPSCRSVLVVTWNIDAPLLRTDVCVMDDRNRRGAIRETNTVLSLLKPSQKKMSILHDSMMEF